MSNTPSRVLIVEDEATIASMYRFKLEREGFIVQCAYNGEEGLSSAQLFNPQLILLDLKMPNLTGDKMLEQLRAQDWGKNMRVIILTNISRDEAPSNLQFLNVDRYIVKAHYTPAQVVDVVVDVLKSNSDPK